MKQVFRALLACLVTVSMLGLASCEKEPANQGNENGGNTVSDLYYETLEGTEWEGTYATTTQTQYGVYPVTIHWTVDFLKDGKGEVMFWQESQAYGPDTYSWKMTYTYDGKNAGVISDGMGEWPVNGDNQWSFTCDPYNRTLQVPLLFEVQHVQDGPIVTYGGLTTLHQVR